jgi:thioredoxin reductase (NADPH)
VCALTQQYDLLIIGGGPAGLSAAIYGARARLKTGVIEKGAIGGQAFTTREIVNFPGFASITGPALMRSLADHAIGFGAEFIAEEVTSVDFRSELKQIKTKKGNTYQARAVILAPGAKPRLLNIPGEKAFRGNGVSYCATCDAEFYRNQHVVVVGNGDAAVEEAMFITKFARKVTIIVIHDEGIVDCNRASTEKAFQHPKIEFVWNSVLTEIKGDCEVKSVVLKNLKTGNLTEMPANGVFIYVGMIPGTGFLNNQVELDERGYIIAGSAMETSVDGVFAAGDVTVKYLRQIVTAANDGAVAAVAAERYLEEEHSFKQEILDAETPVLLVFWNPTDSECISMLSRLEALTSVVEKRVKLVKIDISRKKRLAQKYKVEETPTVLLLNKGTLIKKVTGEVEENCFQLDDSIIAP